MDSKLNFSDVLA